MRRTGLVALAGVLAGAHVPAAAQTRDVAADLAAARAEIAAQRARLEEQERRLQALEARIAAGASANGGVVTPPEGAPAPAVSVAQGSAPGSPGDPATIQQAPVLQSVGQAPDEELSPIDIAVLGAGGSAITSAGQLSADFGLEYARADRNRALFRGIEVVESVLVGVFDINESRQDVITASAGLRYGITDALEFGIRFPYVYRADNSVLAPIAGSTNNDAARTVDSSANGDGLGDLEASFRYQLNRGGIGRPFFIANLQVVAPTGTNPFDVRRDENGRALEAATGAGFWGVSPSITAILPTDPAVLFGTLGYTRNFGDDVNARIPPVIVEYVKPGDALSASAGIGLSLNQRTSLNLGYAHSWAFGTRTRTRLIETPRNGVNEPITQTARDLQLGRLLFGVTYRATDYASLNWSVEVGATDDATDVRTVLRVPIVLFAGQ